MPGPAAIAPLLLALVAMALAQASPSVYWQSLPTLANETLLLAGADMMGASLIFCPDPLCVQPLDPSAQPRPLINDSDVTWAGVLPSPLPTPPIQMKLCRSNSTSVCTPLPPLNAPAATWAQGPKGYNSASSGIYELYNLSPTVVAVCGQPLRVYGRALGFDPTSLDCVHTAQPSSQSNVTLQLVGLAQPLRAVRATCYDAEFLLPAAGCQEGLTTTPKLTNYYGTSLLPMAIQLVMPAPAPTSQTFDVDQQYEGNLQAALDAAATAIHQGKTPQAVVQLAAHDYSFHSFLFVASNITVMGADTNRTRLIFSLPSNGTAPSKTGLLTAWNGTVAFANFTVLVLSAPAHTPAVLVNSPSFDVSITGLNITLLQSNVSNAIQLSGTVGYELAYNFWNQAGLCLYPYTSDTSPFQPSTSLYLYNTSDGHIHHNTALWRCSYMDLDTSSRVAVTDNNVHLTDAGAIPHGNSISVYDWGHVPASMYWFYGRNSMSRPANNNASNWFQRETVTTDGSGGFFIGAVLDTLGNNGVRLPGQINLKAVGGYLVVLNGTGVGQVRQVVNVTVVSGQNYSDITVTPAWSTGLDLTTSRVGLTARTGHRVIAGNNFSWAEVVQFYGVNYRGVIADNSLFHDNVGSLDYGSASVVGFGECYHGPSPLFFTELNGNHLVSSNSLELSDGGRSTEPECASYPGPWVKWAVARRNFVGGLAEAGRGSSCGNVTVSSQVSYAVAEHNTFDCPAGKPGGQQLVECDTACIGR